MSRRDTRQLHARNISNLRRTHPEIANSSTADGAKVELWNYKGGNNQKFTFTPTSGGYFRITAVSAPNSCLDVSGVSTSPGAIVHQWTYAGGENQ